LKEEAGSSTGRVRGNEEAANSLFADDQKGEWYFYNSSLRQKGLADFKSRWGNRPNTDNWRRSAAQRAGSVANNIAGGNNKGAGGALPEGEDISFESLYANIPLTEEKRKQSEDSVMNALFNVGILYIQELEDCQSGIDSLVALQARFPDFPKMDQVLFNLYYCYQKTGQNTRAAAVKKIMAEEHSQ